MFRLAYSHLEDFHKALSCFEKACKLDPRDESYRINYQYALNSLQAISSIQRIQPLPDGSGFVPGPDYLGLILNLESFTG